MITDADGREPVVPQAGSLGLDAVGNYYGLVEYVGAQHGLLGRSASYLQNLTWWD